MADALTADLTITEGQYKDAPWAPNGGGNGLTLTYGVIASSPGLTAADWSLTTFTLAPPAAGQNAGIELRFNALTDNLVEGNETFTWQAVLANADGTTSAVFTVNVTIVDAPTALIAGPIVGAAITNILRTDPLSASLGGLLGNLVGKLTSGQFTQDQAMAQIVSQAGPTTSVATLAYEFFTGKIPSAPGMDYLVSPTGPNANNLNSAYYQSFDLENRYINFAVNLGKLGDGAAAFNAAYGSESLFDATKAAYTTIFGSAPTDDKVHALIDSRVDYFAYYGHDGANGIGTKAAMVGWLLAEAEKADVGMYAKANDAFLTDLADGATFAVDLVGVYGKPEFVLGA